jgi:hypothetical protein
VKFEGMLGRMFTCSAGRAPRRHRGRTAVKGNRKATLNENTGQIVDLSEEKVYDIDFKKKQYTVTTFDEIRRRMREAEERRRRKPRRKNRAQGRSSRPRSTRSTSTSRTPARRSDRRLRHEEHHRHVTVREKGKTLETGRRHGDDQRHVARARRSRR